MAIYQRLLTDKASQIRGITTGGNKYERFEHKERTFIPEEPCCTTPETAGLTEKESLSEARLSGIFYF